MINVFIAHTNANIVPKKIFFYILADYSEKMFDRQHTLCFTGHRHYSGGADREERLARAIEEAYAEGYRVFISGMAEGFDLAAAEAVLRLREKYPEVLLVAAIPFKRQTRGFSTDNKARYEAIIAAATEVVTLREHYTYRCYWERDDWMVAHSSRVVCWYDGSKGGTRYTVRSALTASLDIINLYSSPDTLF
jgi:uncharacterized phage-like protein YoqJ